MKTPNLEITFSETLIKELSNEAGFDQALEKFKTFRNDLMTPREYADLLKKLQEALLGLQAEGLDAIKLLEESIKGFPQDHS